MEPIEGSETSAFKPQTPGKYPKENILHKEHGESLKSRRYRRMLSQYVRLSRDVCDLDVIRNKGSHGFTCIAFES